MLYSYNLHYVNQSGNENQPKRKYIGLFRNIKACVEFKKKDREMYAKE
jgi:hypothetical protein